MRILVTGATGFVGGHLVEALCTKGHTVRALVRRRVDTPWLDMTEQVEGNVTDRASIRFAVQDCDAVVHCAAVSGYEVAPEAWEVVNVRGTENVIEACRAAGVRRLVHLSTFLVHELTPGELIDEARPYAANPSAGYVASKIAADKLAQSAARDLSIVVLRPGVVYGPRDGAVMPRLVAQLSAGRFSFVAGGRFRCHLVYVDNLVDAVVASIERANTAGPYIVLDDPAVEVREFICAIADGLGLPRPRRSIPISVAKAVDATRAWLPRAFRWGPLTRSFGMGAFTLDVHFSTERARRELGYSSRIPYRAGMERTIAWAREHGFARKSPVHARRDAGRIR